MRVVVIGAGPTGLTAAHRLACAGAEVDVFDAAPQVGGLARSFELWGRWVDLGSHVFSTADPRVLELWLRLLGDDVRWLRLRRGVFTGDAVVSYPVRVGDVLRKQSIVSSARCGLGFLRSRLNLSPPVAEDAETWMVQRYGRPLYERYFEAYARKLWGVPCVEIDAGFARDHFAGAPVAIVSIDRFPYPALGTGSVWVRMADELESRGGRLHLGEPVRELLVEAGRVVGVQTRDGEYAADHVVSSMPLPLLMRVLPDIPPELVRSSRGLRARSTILVYLRLANADVVDANWLYVYPPEYRLGRVTAIDEWMATEARSQGDNVVCVEYWCDHDDATWSSPDSDLAALAGDELVRTGLVGAAEVVGSHILRLRGTHPVPARGHREVLAAAQAYVESVDGVSSVGRHGQFGVPGVGRCMEAAFETADLVLAGYDKH